jgi:preprotein translocase subunit SecF
MDYYNKIFNKLDYRIAILIPIAIALLLIPSALNIPLGIDFTGGTELQFITSAPVSAEAVEGALSTCAPDVSATVNELGSSTTVLAKSKGNISDSCMSQSLMGIGIPEDEVNKITPTIFKPELGKTLFAEGSKVLSFAIILMVFIVFVAFRTVIPSLAVISAALLDILIALGLLSIFGVELSLAGVAALLMLVGYSVDSDIMLTTKTIKQNKPFEQSVNEAFVTGITMTGTTIVAMLSIVIVTSFLQMDALGQIASVLLAGLTVDLITTWLMNVGILKWYVGRKKTSGPSKFKFSIFRS